MKATVHGLETQLKSLLNPLKDPRKALSVCTKLESAYIQSRDPSVDHPEQDPKQAQTSLRKILGEYTVDAQDLSNAFRAPHLSPESCGMLLDNFNTTKKPVPRQTAMIPFRHAIYNSEFDAALQILDKTAGPSSNLAAAGQSRIHKLALGWSTAVTGVLAGCDQLLSSGLIGDWGSNRPMILVMVFAYTAAVSTYGVLAWGGGSASERAVAWAAGTPIAHRIKFKQELDMAGQLAQMNAALPENQGECAPKLIDELKSRSIKVVESNDEEMLKEYWARGGEGFTWVEPDQDPAELIWMSKAEAQRQKRLGTPYVRRIDGRVHTWEQDVQNIQQGRTIPHASLIDIEALRGPEKMAELEEELQKLRDSIQSLPEGPEDGQGESAPGTEGEGAPKGDARGDAKDSK